jgi:GNAT superfamily N-acetyltransferase
LASTLHIEIRQLDWGSTEYLESVDLRFRLFRQPFGMEYTESELQEEKMQQLFGAFMYGKLVGFCACKQLSSNLYQGRQMVVEPKYQGHNIGTQLVRAREVYILSQGAKEIILHVRNESVDFYIKQDYSVRGDKFFFKTVDHWEMTKQLGV